MRAAHRAADVVAVPASAEPGGVEAQLVCARLRRALAWPVLGLSRPPDEHCLDDPSALASGGETELEATWLCQAEGLQPLGLVVDRGLDQPGDRTRVGELFWLDEVSPDTQRAAAAALVGLLVATRRVRAMRCPAGGALASLLTAVYGEAVKGFAHGEARWSQLVLAASAAPAAQATSIELTLPASLLRRHGYRAPASRAPRAALPEVIVRSAAEAHGQLVSGNGPWRGLTYPERAPPEDVELLVVGAGIAGVTTAYASRDRRVVLLERDDRIGGTGAAYQALQGGRFALAAHYECDPTPSFGAELLSFYERAGFITPEPGTGGYRFVDERHYVRAERSEQSIDPSGALTTRGFTVFQTEPEAMRLRDAVLEATPGWPMLTRHAPPQARALGGLSFRAWLDARGFSRGIELERRMNVLLRSDYAAPAEGISAYAGLHYFGCRPYLTRGSRTFAPPEGLTYFAERLLSAAPQAELRLRHMVTRLTDRGDHVEVRALDLEARATRRFRARQVVVTTPKKQVRFVHPPDATLFATSQHAPWLTVTFELARRVPEQELLAWANHVAEPTQTHIGITWHNHAAADAPAIFSHYFAFEPCRANHVKLLLLRPRAIVERCLAAHRVFFGRDLLADTARIVVQKLGHAMATPVPGALFTDPNARRACERVIYAGVDTGRLPLVSEAFDSALEAADLLNVATSAGVAARAVSA